jgi:hypothetical protein
MEDFEKEIIRRSLENMSKATSRLKGLLTPGAITQPKKHEVRTEVNEAGRVIHYYDDGSFYYED